MRADARKSTPEHPDRDLHCQESIEPLMQRIIAYANANGFGTVETMNAMNEVLQHLRVAYDEDPDPQDDPLD